MGRRRAGLASALEGFADDHTPAATRAWRPDLVRFARSIGRDRLHNPKQFAGTFEMRLAGGAGEQAIVTDAVEALGQDVE